MSKRKINLLLLSSVIVVIMSMVIIVGYSLWIVSIKKDIIPTYGFEDLFENNLTLETSYINDYVGIEDADKDKFNISINYTDFNITYLDSSKEQLTNSYPKDAGTYYVKIESKTLKDENGKLRAAYVKYVVHPATIYFAESGMLNIVDSKSQIVDPKDTTKTLITSSSIVTNIEITDAGKTTTEFPGAVYYWGKDTTSTQSKSLIKKHANDDTTNGLVKIKVEGTFTLKEDQTLTVGINNYNCSFTPTDTNNFYSLDKIDVSINVRATIKYQDFDGNDFGNISYSNSTGTVEELEQTPTIDESTGYTFGGWKFNNEKWTSDKQVTSDMTLTPIKEPIKYTITYNLDGGTNNPNNPTTYTIETETFSLEAPNRAKYSFSGWTSINYTTPTIKPNIEKGTTGNLEFTAHWERTIFVPTASTTEYIYNGSTQTYDITYDAEACTIVGHEQKNAGTYQVTISLKDDTDKWADGETTPKTYEFIIKKKQLTASFDVEVTNGTVSAAKTLIEYSDAINVAVTNLNIVGLANGETGNIEYIYSVTDKTTNLTSDTVTVTSHTFTNTLKISDTCSSTVTIKSNDTNYELTKTASKNFSIKRLRVYVKNDILEQSVTDTRTWSAAQTYLNSNVKFIRYLTKEEFVVSAKTLLGMQDGQFRYGTPSENSNLNNKVKITTTEGSSLEIDTNATTYLVGSTYYVYYSVTSPYQMVNMDSGEATDVNNFLVYKYKTVYSNNTYYTIEDALTNSSSDVFMWGDVTNSTSYGLTTFTSIRSLYADTTTYNLSNRKIYAPYTLNSATLKDTNGTGSNVFSCLIIPNSITINLKGSSELAACSSIANGSQGAIASVQRGVIYNNGIINAYDTTTIYAYGYIKGMGKLNLYNTSKAHDVLRTINFSGGSAATENSTGLLNRTLEIVPFSEYTIHNISCETKITSNVEYYSYFKTTVGGSNTDYDVLIIGKPDSSSCLFKAKSVSNNNYIIKKAANAVNKSTNTDLYTITGANQTRNAGQRDIIDIYGSYTDGSISISISISIGTGSIKTSTSLLLPISYMHITIKNGGNLDLVNSDYMFLPGTSLMIEENAECTVGNNVDLNIAPYSVITKTHMPDCVDTFDAKLIVNGTLNVLGNVGGTISVESTQGKLNITGSTDSYYDLYYTYNEPYRVKGNLSARGYLAISSTARKESNIASGTYISVQVGDNQFAWGQTEGKLVYVLNNGNGTIDGPIHSLTSGSITISSPEVSDPTREHYTFGGWYTDETYTKPAFPFELNISSKIYAKWIPIDYNISYEYVYNECQATGSDIINSNINDENQQVTKYNCESIIDLVPASDGNLVFAGWFTDENCTNQIFRIENMAGNITLYGLWYKAGTVTITINYEFDVEDKEIKNMLAIAGITLEKDSDKIISTNTSWEPNKIGTTYTNDITFAYWFDCWYFDSGYSIEFNATDFATYIESLTSPDYDGEKIITLYGIVRNKNKIIFEKDDTIFAYDNYVESIYLYPNQKYTLTGTDLSTEISDSVSCVTIFDGLHVSATNEIIKHDSGENNKYTISFSTSYSNDITIKPAKTNYYKVSLEFSNATVSITASSVLKSDKTVGSQTISSSGSYMFVKENTNFTYNATATQNKNLFSGISTSSYDSNFTIVYYLSDKTSKTISEKVTHQRNWKYQYTWGSFSKTSGTITVK